ncbi:hypothetical protein Poli38472_001966 [Pythium oligandrum]|uniref:Uncharacterized protein n=1 Tax=Pythium oligandrum TaxID=41045 RepID=A0A8K1FQU9_PYTOL|nr:hypothetical protein Poli38472_001965 [Pythium oligandrum]TMW69810.1 hypothetical protein Poli38472_001966 [Pythium oligandrum]|eukprot:TMW69809.1 hypothetical protein Poli38472_001965 [Pythium oligandrum]
MKTIHAALPLAVSLVLGQALADKYSAVCIFDELKCGGDIQLREYAPAKDGGCKSGSCTPVPTKDSKFSFLPTCTDDIVKDTEAHLGGRSYVIVQFYDGEGCAGDFSSALAVATNGKCYPTSDGKTSYQVSTNSTSVNWTKFMGTDCAGSNGTTVSFNVSSADGSTCLPGNIKALASIEGAAPVEGAPSPVPSPSSAVGVAPSILAVGVAAASAAALSVLN